MTTDGGGWTLVTRMSSAGDLTLTQYDDYFANDLWINGASEGIPTTTDSATEDFVVESLSWGLFLTDGAEHELRQNFFKSGGGNEFDVGYTFTYPGYTDQNSAPDGEGAWVLTERNVYTDESGVGWDVDSSDTVRFWLPFHRGILDEGREAIITGCGGFRMDASGCDVEGSGKYGRAGISGSTADDQDPAAGFAPDIRSPSLGDWIDLVYVSQADSTYGRTGHDMTLLYWLR